MKKIFNIVFLGSVLITCIGYSSDNLKNLESSKKYKLVSYTKIGNTSTHLTSESAKKLALKHAKLSEKDVTFTKIKLNTSNGKLIYDIQFFVNGKEYNYSIDANTGKIY